MLNTAAGVASTPYQAYTGELTAPVNAEQTSGINNINSSAGFAQPYIQQAAGYANQAAQPITAAQIAQYQSPYTQQVVNATQAQFANQNAQQQNSLVGNAASQNALGGDRVGVAQAQLAGQQNLAQAPVIAGLYNQGYGTALQTALGEQQNLGNAAYSLGNLGVAGQGAALQGAGAQIGAGTLQQGTQQAQDTAAYNQFVQQQAFPYQQTQWLAGIDTGVGSQLGGTSTGTSTPPAPNPIAQYGGLGLAATGLFLKRGGKVPGFDAGGSAPLSGTPYAGVSGYVPTMNITPGQGAPRVAGFAAPQQQQPMSIKDGMALANSLQGKLGSHFGSQGNNGLSTDTPDNGTGIYTGDASVPGFGYDAFPGTASNPLPGLSADDYGMKRGGFVRGYDDGGSVMQAGFGTGSIVPEWPASFSDRFSGASDPIWVNPMAGVAARPEATPDAMPAPKQDAAWDATPVYDTPGPNRVAPEDVPMAGVAADSVPPDDGELPENAELDSGRSPFNMGSTRAQAGFGISNFAGLSPAAKAGLLAAGLGAMASRSPNLGNAIGEGGLQGLQAYSGAKAAEQKGATEAKKIELESQRLSQAAKQAAERLKLQTDTLGETKHYHSILDQQRKDALTERQTRAGFVRNADGTMTPIKGGPADPEQIAAVAKAKQTGGLLPDETADFLAERVLAGDARALIGLGRGAQGAENISKIQTLAARKAADRGMSPSDVLAKVAEQSGFTAQQRTFGTQTARMAINSTEAQGAIDLGRKASADVPRTNWVPVNKAIQAFQTGTSDPKLAQFGAANLAIVNTYARAISPTGTPTVHDKEHAEHLLSTATGPEAYNALLDQLNKEIEIAHAAPLKAKQELERIRKAPKEGGAPVAEFTGRTASGPNGQKLRETNDGRWVP